MRGAHASGTLDGRHARSLEHLVGVPPSSGLSSMYMLANVAASAASQRFGAPDDASASRGRSYAQTRSPGWTSAFRGLLRSMPCRTSSGSQRSGGQLRRGGCADTRRLAWGGGEGGASLHPALARHLHGMDKRRARALKGEFQIPVSRAAAQAAFQNDFFQATAKLVEIGSSLFLLRILDADSKRTFQIPASRSQNILGRILRRADFLFLVTKSGPEARDLSAQISQFSFLSSSSRPGLEFETPHISQFSILDTNPRTTTAWR